MRQVYAHSPRYWDESRAPQDRPWRFIRPACRWSHSLATEADQERRRVFREFATVRYVLPTALEKTAMGTILILDAAILCSLERIRR